MLDFLRTTRGRVAAALVTSLAVIAAALVMTDALPILPAALVAVWVPVFGSQRRVEPAARRLLLVLAGALAVLTGVGALAFVLMET